MARKKSSIEPGNANTSDVDAYDGVETMGAYQDVRVNDCDAGRAVRLNQLKAEINSVRLSLRAIGGSVAGNMRAHICNIAGLYGLLQSDNEAKNLLASLLKE